VSPEQLRPLLDPARIAALAARIPALRAHRVTGAELVAFWIKPGRHFNGCYGLDLEPPGAGPLRVSAFALEEARADAVMAKLGPHRCAAAPATGCRPCATARTTTTLVLQLFPFDYRLPRLPACLRPARVRAGLGSASEIVACEPAGYRPGMRCQIRYGFADGTSVFGKVAVERQPGQAFAALQHIHAALAADGTLATPVPVRYVPPLGLSVVAAAPGQPLHEAPFDHSALNRVARALARLHGLALHGIDRIHAPADELALLRSWVELVAALLPEHAAELQAGIAALADAHPPQVPPRALIHRDFYDKQVLLTDDTLTFLDLDTLCRGDPEIDLGNFCAHLQLRARQAGDDHAAAAAEACFLSAYPAPAHSARIHWYRRATLLRLACIYGLRPRWRHLAPSLIAEASRA
jgi:hypothetical protein